MSTSEKIFEFEDVNPCIRKLNCSKGKSDYDKAVRYLSRSDPDNLDLDSFGNNLVNTIWACEDIGEALAHAKNPSEAQGIITLYGKKPVRTFPLRFKELGGEQCPWTANEVQAYVIEKALEANAPDYNPDDANNNRKIIWIANKKGSGGKSQLCTDLLRAKLAHIIIDGGGGCGNVSDNLRRAVMGGWNGRCVIFDFARNLNTKDTDYIYQILEMTKNGMLNASKYESSTVDLGGSPLVIVFANFLPRVYNAVSGEPTMSFDKWEIKIMNNTVGKLGSFNEVESAKVMNEISVASIKYDAMLNADGDVFGSIFAKPAEDKKALKDSGMIDPTDKFMNNYEKTLHTNSGRCSI
jgi:hypothetical protein